MKYFTIDAANTITLHASRRVARKTGSGVFSTEEQLADLIGPDSRRLVDVWNNLPGVKPVTQFGNPKVATERIWRVIQELGVRSIAEPVIELRLGVIEIVARDQANGFPQPN